MTNADHKDCEVRLNRLLRSTASPYHVAKRNICCELCRLPAQTTQTQTNSVRREVTLDLNTNNARSSVKMLHHNGRFSGSASLCLLTFPAASFYKVYNQWLSAIDTIHLGTNTPLLQLRGQPFLKGSLLSLGAHHYAVRAL